MLVARSDGASSGFDEGVPLGEEGYCWYRGDVNLANCISTSFKFWGSGEREARRDRHPDVVLNPPVREPRAGGSKRVLEEKEIKLACLPHMI